MTTTADPANVPLEPPLSVGEFARLRWLTARLPARWTVSRRRRRLLFLGLAAPGFVCVFATPLHQNLAVLLAGLLLFGAACVFRDAPSGCSFALRPPRSGRRVRHPCPGSSTPMRSRRSIVLSAALAASLLLVAQPPAAQAQVAVIDLKAILQAEQQVSQGLTQIQRLESQLSNQAAMLQHLQTDITGPIAQITGQATAILQQAQGIGYGAQNVAQQYASLYPTTMPGASLASTQASLATWRQNNALALQDALRMQNQIAQGQPTTSAQVASAVSASQGAAGQTAAIQASNQLLATVSAQLTQLQNLLITQARAEQTLAAQAQATQAAGAADSQRFWATTPPASRVQNPGQL